MKRLFTFTAILLPLFLQAQEIQQSLLGLTIGKRYTPEKVKSVLEDKYYTIADVSIDNGNREVSAYNISFGGFTWYSTHCVLTKKNRLACVSFQKVFEELEDTKEYTKEVYEALRGKYGEPYVSDHDFQWIDSNRMAISLFYTHAKAKNGEYLYYTILVYRNMDYYKEIEQASTKEL